MTGKKVKVVPSAVEQSSSEPPKTEVAQAEGADVVPQAVSPIQIPPKVIEQAQALGIDLGQIVAWAQSVEARFNAIAENMPVVAKNAMKQAIEEYNAEAQKKYEEMQKQNPQAQQSGGLSQYLPLFQTLLGGGGGSSSSELQEKLMGLAMESLGLGNALQKALLMRMVPEMADKLLEGIPKGAAEKK